MTKIDILGSCVTRDAFKFGGYTLNEYFARTSIISIYSKPISVKMDDIKLPSAFQKRMVYYDLNKKFRSYIQKPTADFLIIDFIDERFPVLKTFDSYLTRSREYVKSELVIKKVTLSDEERLEIWNQKIQEFIKDLNNYGPQRVILHKAYWQVKYRDKSGQIQDFEDEEIQKNNQLLDQYYRMIEEGVKGINLIELDGFVADENHQWGLSPFHYEEGYYVEFMKKLKQITKHN